MQMILDTHSLIHNGEHRKNKLTVVNKWVLCGVFCHRAQDKADEGDVLLSLSVINWLTAYSIRA